MSRNSDIFTSETHIPQKDSSTPSSSSNMPPNSSSNDTSVIYDQYGTPYESQHRRNGYEGEAQHSEYIPHEDHANHRASMPYINNDGYNGSHSYIERRNHHAIDPYHQMPYNQISDIYQPYQSIPNFQSQYSSSEYPSRPIPPNTHSIPPYQSQPNIPPYQSRPPYQSNQNPTSHYGTNSIDHQIYSAYDPQTARRIRRPRPPYHQDGSGYKGRDNYRSYQRDPSRGYRTDRYGFNAKATIRNNEMDFTPLGTKRPREDTNPRFTKRRTEDAFSRRKELAPPRRKQFFFEKYREAQKVHPFPNDIHLLQNPSPQVIHEFDNSNRILDYDVEGKTKPYRYRLDSELVTVNHWGQRKLLFSEIEFLTQYVNPDEEVTVLYAGAGPGTHTQYLSTLFPSVHFVLIDPLPQQQWVVQESDRIEILYGYMTDEHAKQFSSIEENRKSMDPSTHIFRAPKDRVLFISDIRNTMHFKARTLIQHEENIINDNRLQKGWHEIIQPIASMLKFRCPFYNVDKNSEHIKTYEYLDGDIYLPLWGKVETCECRLVVERGKGLKIYDRKIFEEKMMYFNTETRVQYYEHDMDELLKERNIVGIDHCFDCRSELWILDQYLLKHKNILDTNTRKQMIVDMIEQITPMCSKSNRTLAFLEHIGEEIGKAITFYSPDSSESQNENVSDHPSDTHPQQDSIQTVYEPITDTPNTDVPYEN